MTSIVIRFMSAFYLMIGAIIALPSIAMAMGGDDMVSITINVKARKDTALRVLPMVAPTRYKDHFVTGLINPEAGIPIMLDRLDIGHDEGRKSTEWLRPSNVVVTVK